MAKKPENGRPPIYKPEFAQQAYRLCLLSATDANLAEFFGVTEMTVNRWKVAHPAFRQALRAGKVEADANVAESLYKRAIGYSHPETHVTNYQGQITVTNLVKHYPPDTLAAIYWLKNRQPGKWRDRVEVKSEVTGTFPPKEVLDAIYEKAMAEAARRDATLKERRERLGIVTSPDDTDVE